MRLLLAAALFQVTTGLIVYLEGNEEQCYSQPVKMGESITVQFQVTSGGALDIDVRITDKSGAVLKTYKAATEGHFKHTATEATTVKACFHNAGGRWTRKSVSFYLLTSHRAGASKIEHIDPIENAIVDLANAVHDLQSEQMFLRSVEHVHRETVDKTSTRVGLWGVLQAVVAVVALFLHGYYLERFLEIREVA